MTIKVLVVDDHQLMRQGVLALLRRADNIKVVGEARDGMEALNAAKKLKPDVILMDIEMPRLNGLRAAERLASEGLDAKILVLSMKSDEQTIRDAFQAGALGYLLKDSSREELIQAIHDVYHGKQVSSPSISDYFG